MQRIEQCIASQRLIYGWRTSCKSLAQTVHGRRENLKLLAYMLGALLFFAVTLLISFFIVIVAINNMDIPGDVAPNLFMLGIVPPSIGTFLLFTKVLGRFM